MKNKNKWVKDKISEDVSLLEGSQHLRLYEVFSIGIYKNVEDQLFNQIWNQVVMHQDIGESLKKQINIFSKKRENIY